MKERCVALSFGVWWQQLVLNKTRDILQSFDWNKQTCGFACGKRKKKTALVMPAECKLLL